MRRQNNLYQQVCSFDNLLLAARKAQKGKRFSAGCRTFNLNLEGNLLALQEALQDKSYCPGEYRRFNIFKPKARVISAAPYRDRVVHHALVNVIEPFFEKSMIGDSYANRIDKGTLAAVNRFTEFSRKAAYVLKMDVVKYFPSIDHGILMGMLERKIKDRNILLLIRSILATGAETDDNGDLTYYHGDDLFSPVMRERGLPIGNLTSQLFANVYLTGFDYFVKETLQCRHYIRYMDDMVVFDNDKRRLHDIRAAMIDELEERRLRIHERRAQIWPVKQGTDWLGYRVYPTHRRLRKSNIRKFRHRMKEHIEAYRDGNITIDAVTASVKSWVAYAGNADSYKIRTKVFGEFVFRRGQA